MKKIYTFKIIVIFATAFITGCSKETKISKQMDSDIQGCWIESTVDGKNVITDAVKIMSFNKGIFTLTGKFIEIDGNEYWSSGNRGIYRFDGEDCSINVNITTSTSIHKLIQEIKILDINQNSFTAQVEKNKYDGRDGKNNYWINCTRYIQNADYNKDLIIGCWKAQTRDGKDYDEFVTEYKNDGTFEYYYKTPDGYIHKRDNSGKYYLYDDFFVTTWYNDMRSGYSSDMKYHVECWNLNFFENDSTMVWNGLRDNGKSESIKLIRIDKKSITNK